MIQPQDRILFIGDSITDAFRKPEEINDAYQMGNGYAFLVASQLRAQRPADALLFFNRGISGEGLRGLEARWDNDVLALRPDVISVLVGINDTLCAFRGHEVSSPDDVGARYLALLEYTRKVLPDVRFVVCEPFLLRADEITDEKIAHLRERAAAIRQSSTRFGAVFVPFQEMLDAACNIAPPEYWAYDGIHPTAAGHFLLARQWLEVVENTR